MAKIPSVRCDSTARAAKLHLKAVASELKLFWTLKFSREMKDFNNTPNSSHRESSKTREKLEKIS